MRLSKVHVTEYQSIIDSTEFDINDITCLVGKNEAGKTALLKALYRLKPIVDTDGDYDIDIDYPQRKMISYKNDVEAGRRPPAQVVSATFELEPDDAAAVEAIYGPDCLPDDTSRVVLCKGYDNRRTFSGLRVDEKATLKFLIQQAGLSSSLEDELLEHDTVDDMVSAVGAAEQTEAVKKLKPMLEKIAKNNVGYVVYNDVLHSRIPKFLYFDDYYQLEGQVNVQKLQERIRNGNLRDSDRPLLGLLELARLNLDDMVNPSRTAVLISQLEAAENQLTAQVLKFWSQNRHLRLKFDIRPAAPNDPEGMTSGQNIWGQVKDTKHQVSTPLGTRSRGFVWFFSFLAWYSQIQRNGENVILLLDEPGLSLHARAQEDLLDYFRTELAPNHQLIYTTHSPFMVDPRRLDRVRIVQDLSIERGSDDLPDELQGTRVVTEVLEASEDSLFPLQGALGFDIYQTLFVGPDSLVVEGVSDLLYLQAVSSLLQRKGEPGLDTKWTITPVGGSDKVPTFVAMIGAKSRMHVAVLVDFQKKDQQTIENLYKSKLLKKNHVLTFADFVKSKEADIEDMFNPGYYLKLVNGEFGTSIKVEDLPVGPPRILVRLEQYFAEHPLPDGATFNHYRPARYFVENVESMEMSDSQLGRFRAAFAALNALL